MSSLLDRGWLLVLAWAWALFAEEDLYHLDTGVADVC